MQLEKLANAEPVQFFPTSELILSPFQKETYVPCFMLLVVLCSLLLNIQSQKPALMEKPAESELCELSLEKPAEF